jgi:hypothetical protein
VNSWVKLGGNRKNERGQGQGARSEPRDIGNGQFKLRNTPNRWKAEFEGAEECATPKGNQRCELRCNIQATFCV